jgi:Helicase HerA, central domain
MILTIAVDNFTRHMCILEATGKGKSVSAKVVASELLWVGDVAALIPDRTGEFARSDLATQACVNVLIPGVNLTISPSDRRSDNMEDDIEQAGQLGGKVSVKSVQRALDSNRKLKQLVHGRYPLFEERGSDLVFTKLGQKICAILSMPEPASSTADEPNGPVST